MNTLKNIRISLQKKLERQPLGTIQDMGNGRIKKLFTDDIDQVELLLAHAIPEGISNLAMTLSFAGKFPQLGYKIDEIEKAMDSEPLKLKIIRLSVIHIS